MLSLVSDIYNRLPNFPDGVSLVNSRIMRNSTVYLPALFYSVVWMNDIYCDLSWTCGQFAKFWEETPGV